MNSPLVLITGGAGFLGRAVARRFAQEGAVVHGLGHSSWSLDDARSLGYTRWRKADVRLEELAALGRGYDIIVHCAGSGSVPLSLQDPLEAYRRTVESTAELLEYVRQAANDAVVVYPSSAAVYGAAPDVPLAEDHPSHPVSPYGYHKRIVEDLLRCHSEHFGVRVRVIRFFSIYGPGLRRQLLWDATCRFGAAQGPVTFFGTGQETRDWIHVEDAASLVRHLACGHEAWQVFNGAAGERVTVSDVLHRLRDALGIKAPIKFNGQTRAGDPRYYHADIQAACHLGWRPAIGLAQGLAGYASWVRDEAAAASR